MKEKKIIKRMMQVLTKIITQREEKIDSDYSIAPK